MLTVQITNQDNITKVFPLEVESDTVLRGSQWLSGLVVNDDISESMDSFTDTSYGMVSEQITMCFNEGHIVSDTLSDFNDYVYGSYVIMLNDKVTTFTEIEEFLSTVSI